LSTYERKLSHRSIGGNEHKLPRADLGKLVSTLPARSSRGVTLEAVLSRA
jgi:hypothetical protein